jgi:hypothetical protein
MTCSTKKKEYNNIDAAEIALIEARIRFEGNTAVNVYACDECGTWHLTSQGETNPRLQEMIDSGTLEEEIKKYEWRERYSKFD